MEDDMHLSSFPTGDQVLLDNLNVDKLPRLDAQAILKLAVIFFTLDEQERQERSEKDRLAILEKETLEDDYRQRLETLQDYYKQLQEDYEDIDEIERCRLKRARNLALAVGSSVSTQQSVQRRMWIRLRSQAWWEKCNHPAFPVAEFHMHTEKNRGRTAYSITLQGTVDTKGSLTDVCIGWPGSMTDERVLENSALYQRGTSGSLQGCWVAGDRSFPLLNWLLVPYAAENISWAQQTFNEKVEEALKVAKDAFGRLKGRWKFLQKRTEVKLQDLPAVLGACCVLHNICEQRNEGFSPDLAIEVFDDLTPVENATWPMHALQSRDAIAQSLLQQVQLSAAFL
eukprot:jgi/Mesen1/399/ME000010S_10863